MFFFFFIYMISHQLLPCLPCHIKKACYAIPYSINTICMPYDIFHISKTIWCRYYISNNILSNSIWCYSIYHINIWYRMPYIHTATNETSMMKNRMFSVISKHLESQVLHVSRSMRRLVSCYWDKVATGSVNKSCTSFECIGALRNRRATFVTWL